MADVSHSEPLWARAEKALRARAAPLPLGDFWAEVANLGWSVRRQDPEACGAELAARLSPERLVAMRLRFEQLEAQLQRAIELWELQNEESLGLPPELQAALRAHVIALGEIPYGAAVQGPWRVKHRADRDDYLEGFERIFEEALRRYPADVLERALAP